MSSIRVSGNTSGHYDLTVPDVAGSNTIALDKIVVTDSSGNVGIGTSSPSHKLSVITDVDSFVMKVENDGNSAGTVGNAYADASDGLWVDTRWNTATNTPFKVTSNSGTADMMIIKGDGKVGIGTAQPDLTLHVDGVNGYPATSGSTPVGHIAIRAKNESSSHGANIGVADAAPWGTWIQAQDAGNLSTEYPLLLNPNGGNVGIGTSNPNKELTVNGNAHVGRNSSSIPNTSLASNLDFLQVGASTFIQAGSDSQAFIKANHYWNGSGTSYVNTSYGSTTVRLNENNDGKFQIETAPASGTGTTPRLIINNAGAVTKPYQPHWFGTNTNNHATDSSTWITHGSGNNGGAGTGILKFNSAYSSSGSEWNGQRYTATVAGLYYFDLTLDMLNATTIVFRGLKNGGRFHDEERIANLGSGWWNYNYSGHVYLNVNDYFEVSLSNGTWNNIAGGVWSKFGIRLVL